MMHVPEGMGSLRRGVTNIMKGGEGSGVYGSSKWGTISPEAGLAERHMGSPASPHLCQNPHRCHPWSRVAHPRLGDSEKVSHPDLLKASGSPTYIS